MVSRRNFISISIMMLTLLFMFMATQVYHEYMAENERNEFIPEYVISGADEWQQDVFDVADPYLDTQYVLFLGNENSSVGQTVQKWCRYTKRNLVTCEDLNGFAGSIGENQEYVLVESANLDIQKDLQTLNQFAEAGVNIVFCDLPQPQKISQSPQLQQMLGISRIQDENVTADGIKLFAGFLLGGEVTYNKEDEFQDKDLEMPWYQLGAGAQTYMVGLLDEQRMADEGVTRETLPALMWSYTDGDSKIFAINGEYLHDNTGIGILSAIDAEFSDHALYPILNAQLLTVANYPGLADENADEMRRIFSGSMIQAGRDAVYPQLVATAEQTGFVMSCMLQTQYDYQDANDPQASAFNEYAKLMKKAGAEMGISLERKGDVALEEKLVEDQQFMERTNSQYQFGAVYSACDSFEEIVAADSLPDSVNTVVSVQNAAQDLISFGNENVTVQAITSDASVHSFRSDLYMRSVQSALGYTNVLLDLNRVFWPDESEESWEKLSKRYADNLYTDWKAFQTFEDVTVSGSDQKIRQLLVMDYNQVRKGNVIYLELDNTEQPVSFILRLHNEKPEYVSGGDCVELEDGMYLIRTTEQFVEIHLTSSNPIKSN